MTETTIEVDGMACEGCENTVTDALESLEGVSSVTANHEASEVRVVHEETLVDESSIADAIENVGYSV
ncbi:heavy-metal-associated domain-containing protein [Natrialba swarupiae]|uniref:Heavy-metal-associated domain-containing protein n=1 Tax=Natrialba swarupiae TaxID=2448032 RepID=A0A5D5AKH7_9EURY|nr:heavy-metal-associated domain-containing protein [Natrialba swarupiae]MCW8172764.1 copper chaperone [Natrialba swarupiae]TYT61337.1 heavy-metal-associated domain-containing protein [Natrialba swarupiae]